RTDFLVNTTQTGNQLSPAVAADGHGNFVVVWEGFNPATSHTSIFAQRYQSDGTALGSEVVVNTRTTIDAHLPKVAADAVGDFVVVWSGPNKNDIWERRFNATGQPVTNEVPLDAATAGSDTGARVALS